MVNLTFDATQVEPHAGFENLPPGWYNAVIDDSDMRPTKDGKGAYLALRFSVLDGQCAGRKVFTRFNLQNDSPAAREIAMKQLSAVCHAIGVLNLQDSQQLHGQPMKISVRIRKGEGGYEDQNEINSFKNINHVPGGAVQPSAPAMVPQGAGPSAPVGWGAPQQPPQGAPQPPQPWAQPQQQPQPPQQTWTAPQAPAPQAPAPQAPAQPVQPPQTWAPPPPPAAAPPAAAPPTGWTPPAAPQPWAPAAPAPAAPPAAAPTAPPAGPVPPWAQPRQ